MALYTYKIGWALDDDTGQFMPNTEGTFSAVEGGPALPVFDLAGQPLKLVTNSRGKIPYFRSEIPMGSVDFGAGPAPVVCIEGAEAAAQLPELKSLMEQQAQAAQSAQEAAQEAAKTAQLSGLSPEDLARTVMQDLVDQSTGKIRPEYLPATTTTTGPATDQTNYDTTLAAMTAAFPGV